MPELPDISNYIDALTPRIIGSAIEKAQLISPFVLRSVRPPFKSIDGRTVRGVRRIGKQIVIHLEEDLFIVIHLMLAGRLKWKTPGSGRAGRQALAAFEFTAGTLILTEAGSRKRASIHLTQGEAELSRFDRGALELDQCSLAEFQTAIRRENHTLKRSLTDPRLFSAIGNAYSDEILHRARLSPLKLTSKLSDAETDRLLNACRDTLAQWRTQLRAETGTAFPSKVTAFRPGMAVHGKYGKDCPVCGSRVQRIVYAENECNYCATCQTGGRLLADRAISRLLRQDWPRSLDEWDAHIEERKRMRPPPER